MNTPVRTDPPYVPIRSTGWATRRSPLWVLVVIYIFGAFVPPAFGAVVDHTNFTVAWEALGVIVLAGFIPGFFAQRLMRQPA